MALFGGGGKPEIPSGVANLAQVLQATGTAQAEEAQPLATESANLLNMLLSGQIPTSMQPLITAGAEGTRHMASEQVRQGEQQAAAAGLSGTPLAQILSQLYGGAGAAVAGYNPIADALATIVPQLFQLPEQSMANLAGAGNVLKAGTTVSPETGGVAGGIGGALSGAISGGTTGAAFGPYGALIGAGIGAGLGGYAGSR